MKRLLIFVSLLVSVSLTKCNNTNDALDFSIFIPVECRLTPSDTVTISVNGNIPSNATIEWQVDRGQIESTGMRMAKFTAPASPGMVVIKVLVTVNNITSSQDKTCSIEIPTSEPLSITIAPNNPDTILANPQEIESDIGQNTAISPIQYTISITEVGPNPCGPEDEHINEYIELYNYGSVSVDLSELLIKTSNQKEKADKIVSWFSRNPGDNFGNQLILDSTILEPKKYAVIVSPIYRMGTSRNITPYFFPEGTLILTIKQGDRIGNKNLNLYSEVEPLDAILLYKGSETRIDLYISSYGLNKEKLNLENLSEFYQRGFPFFLNDCNAVQRKFPGGDDVSQNWEVIERGNPGEGPK